MVLESVQRPRYTFDGLEFESRWGQEIFVFVKASRPTLLQPPVQRVSGSFPRAKVYFYYLVKVK